LLEDIYAVIGNSIIAQTGGFARVSIPDAMEILK